MYFLTVLEAEKSKIEMLSIWFLDTAVSLACRQLAAFSLCPRVAFPQCWGTGREGERDLIRTLILLNQSPTLMTSFKFSYSLRGPHLQRQPYWGLGLQHTNLRRTQTFSPYWVILFPITTTFLLWILLSTPPTEKYTAGHENKTSSLLQGIQSEDKRKKKFIQTANIYALGQAFLDFPRKCKQTPQRLPPLPP